MTRPSPKTTLQFAVLGALAAWTLNSAERDYTRSRGLTRRTSAAAWTLYLSHLWPTVSAASRSPGRLPVGRKPALALGAVATISGVAFLAAEIQ